MFSAVMVSGMTNMVLIWDLEKSAGRQRGELVPSATARKWCMEIILPSGVCSGPDHWPHTILVLLAKPSCHILGLGWIFFQSLFCLLCVI